MLLELLEYFFLSLPLIALSLWAQAKVLWACRKGATSSTVCGLTGAETAELLLAQSNLSRVTVEPLSWELGSFYDAQDQVLCLSPAAFHGSSVTDVATAAHEVGHAIQAAENYKPSLLRNILVPFTILGSQLFWLLIVTGLFLSTTKLILAGILLLATMLVLQLLNVPAEYDASRRAQALLTASGMIQPDELPAFTKVLSALPWTYVAAAFCAAWLPRLSSRKRITT